MMLRSLLRLAALVAVLAWVLTAPPAAAEDPQALFAQGYELQKDGLHKGAVALFEEGLAADPGNGLAHYYAAESYREMGELDKALGHYRQAGDLLPDGAERTRARNMATALEAEVGGSGGTAATDDDAASSSAAAAATGTVDWQQVVADRATLDRAITDFYAATQPAPEVPNSRLIGIYEMKLEQSAADTALVGFRCNVLAQNGKSRIFRAAAQLAADGGGGYKVVVFDQRERFEIPKGFTY